PRFKTVDFCSLFVKILANTVVLAAFCASIELKSTLFKIFDLKERRFWRIFIRFKRSKADALQD
ncbi:MAG: hypothetical protein IJD71_01405, partial [Clostridia bacterium]|nr:hypothetical protein [Clostridia bacterium]